MTGTLEGLNEIGFGGGTLGSSVLGIFPHRVLGPVEG